MKKTLILGLIVCSLFIVSIGSFVTADGTKEIIDPEDDVYAISLSDEDMTDLKTTYEKPNIDIIKLTYSRAYQRPSVTLTLEVNSRGVIEDKGSDESLTLVGYMLSLETSTSLYEVSYMNKECTVNDAESISYDADGSILTVSFDLDSVDETYVSLFADTMDFSLLSWYFDSAPDTVALLKVTADADPSEGEVGESIDFSVSVVDGGTPPYEWLWDFDDGETSDEQNPTHVFDNAGTYNVTITVTDETEIGLGMDFITLTISPNENNNGANGTNGNNGQSDSSDDSGLILFVALIAIISIVGIIILVYIIRR